MPTQDKLKTLAGWLKTLAGWLGVSVGWLRDGEGPDPGTAAAHGAAALSHRINITEQELLRRYRKLSDRQQQAIVEIITALASKGSQR